MMNNNTDIDALLRRLPAAQTGADFTVNIVTRIATLPATPRRFNGWGIAGICIGGIVAVFLIGWVGDYFSLWSSIHLSFEQSNIYGSFSRIVKAFTSLFDGTTFSPAIWNSFIAGILLLLLDAAIQKHKWIKKGH
ncbi:MAG: hypothetical protein LBD91_04995 [Prevotellaceae bacterium]|jgi:hypothetical protein|nr:hypothetical protein [Prevotellaceae bacterium]